MGLFDKLKDKVKGAAQNVQNAVQPQAQAQPAPQHHEAAEDHDHEEADHDQAPQFDMAGFDPVNDEEAFFNAVLHMESEGQFGGTDESRAEISARYGIRDHSHWLTVKESCYAMLARKYGSYEEVSQQEMNWRSGQMQRHMMGSQQAMAAKGGFEPVEGISLEAWAAINAKIIGGANWEDLLKGAGIDKGRWDRASAEWNARMARDTTFAITTVYGNAFQAASAGKYGDYAREAAAARAANRELSMDIPMSWEQYWEILYEQDYGSKQGRDPVETLKSCGLTIVDWTDLSTFMGYHFNRDAVRHWQDYEAIHKRVEAKMAAKYPGVKVDTDIGFYMSALARWDAFLAQIAERHTAVRTEAQVNARVFIAQIAAAGDYQPLSHQWMAIENRLRELETKIIDTWNEKVDDAITGEGHPTAERDRQRAKGQALKDALDDARCELEPKIFAELARARAQHGQFADLAAIGSHALSQEASVVEWRLMRNAERAMHAQRPPYSIDSLKNYERAQIAYWFKYLSARSQYEPILARDLPMEVRSRMEQWYTMFADHEKSWVAAGRPRERI